MATLKAAAAPAADIASQWTSLPKRLGRFLTKYPPQLYSAQHTGIALPLTRREAKEMAIAAKLAQETEIPAVQSKITQSEGQTTETIVPPPDSTASTLPTADTPSPAEALSSPAAASLSSTLPEATATTITPTPLTTTSRANRLPSNPFLPFRNPVTGRWAGARISLRTQADLVKLAKKSNVEHLLPPGRKSTAFKEARILERGLRVRGTGEGQRVKGHKWERTMADTLQKRKEALENMPALVREWQARGHGRGWKVWPKVKGPRS